MMIVMRKRRDYGEEKRLWEELIACFPFIWHKSYKQRKNYGSQKEQCDFVSLLLSFQNTKIGYKWDYDIAQASDKGGEQISLSLSWL
jgi:hypothetical protein